MTSNPCFGIIAVIYAKTWKGKGDWAVMQRFCASMILMSMMSLILIALALRDEARSVFVVRRR